MPEGKVVRGYVVPGLPHLVLGKEVGPWAELRRAYRAAAESLERAKPDVLVVFSTQWISVLGHFFQGDPNPKGVHVDENWHDLGDLPFDLRVDVELAQKAVEVAEASGLQARTVNYHGFPLDTGTLIALRFLNRLNTIPICSVACNIYAGRDDEVALGRATAQAIRQLGRRAVAVACTGLSGHLFREDISPDRDRIAQPQDDEWNRRLLDLIGQGKSLEVMDIIPQYAKETAADMMFKAFYWLMGMLGSRNVPGKVLGYGPLWGGGAAIVEFEAGKSAWVYRAAASQGRVPIASGGQR